MELAMSNVGSCLCGAIEVTCDSVPSEIIACHCTSCQAATGGVATYSIVMTETDCRITKGSPKKFEEKADSGNNLERFFCGDCGSPIYSATPAFPGHMILKAGLFQKLGGLNIVTNIYTGSAPEWAPMKEGVPDSPGMPGS
ncbi:MAG: aldehyde-activating protein [Rhodospirillaceae bacterium]|nr:aldehyde-activating protein [Rhodospirillaceae bacterium]